MLPGGTGRQALHQEEGQWPIAHSWAVGDDYTVDVRGWLPIAPLPRTRAVTAPTQTASTVSHVCPPCRSCLPSPTSRRKMARHTSSLALISGVAVAGTSMMHGPRREPRCVRGQRCSLAAASCTPAVRHATRPPRLHPHPLGPPSPNACMYDTDLWCCGDVAQAPIRRPASASASSSAIRSAGYAQRPTMCSACHPILRGRCRRPFRR
jgi:hypothetical protein